MAPSSAGGRDCSNYCQMPWPLQANAMATLDTIALSSAGGHNCSNHCQTPWPLRIPWLHHLLAAATAPTIVKCHGHYKQHGSIICWQPQLLQLLSNTMATSNTMAPLSAGGRDCSNYCQMPWPLQIPWLHHLLVAVTAPTIANAMATNAMATLDTIALSSAGGCNCLLNHQTPWPLRIPRLHYLLAAATAPTIVECHGHFKYHGSLICWRPRLLRPLSNAMATLNTIAPLSAGGRDCKYHGSIICWRPLLLPPSSHVMANSNTMALDIICWRPQLLPPSLNVMATLNNIAPSSSGGRNYSNHCQKPWPL
eukprot:CAMPEP_0202028576 /NCGR_PEP_ID=MMETSP0905-20130828/63524_1 /ASSEMBLY_ACC=CAM_ASM_000554 /TAXON_ID=420261 /ORGANISM="Thalassiosira antarctica, Strain CCMP982" /LENGTH=308 /DNA_ID=CAMNT_0048592291 /DNA_START=438 /DNA_END=1365 /DNA_ORIENTATION=-